MPSGGTSLASASIVQILEEPERGMTLLEIVVAASLSLVLVLGALGLLQSLRRSYLRTELATDATERVRIAMESLRHDLQRTGAGVDPDGTPGRPDETIEGAWAGALAARGDLDESDPSRRDDPESWIAGVFPSTRTGNDEIFIYALRKESGGVGQDLTFEADAASPSVVTTPAGDRVAERDGVVEAVRLTRLGGSSGAPAGVGYVLYRGTLTNNASLWGTGNAIVWQPLADGISTLAFRYFDLGGEEVPPPGGAQSDREARRKIVAIEVRLVALEKRADSVWEDPADPSAATMSYRKAEGIERVTLRSVAGATRADRPRPPA